jgi:hypothetical protein
LLAIQMILGQLSAAWCPANPLITFSSSAQSCLDFAKALNTASKGSKSRMQVETCWNCRSWTFSKSFEVFKCHWWVKHVNQPNVSMVLLGQAVKCPTSPTPKGQASKWYAMAKVSMAWLPSYGEMIQDATVCQCIFCSVCPGPEATSAHIFSGYVLDMIYKYICIWSYIYTYIIYVCGYISIYLHSACQSTWSQRLPKSRIQISNSWVNPNIEVEDVISPTHWYGRMAWQLKLRRLPNLPCNAVVL